MSAQFCRISPREKEVAYNYSAMHILCFTLWGNYVSDKSNAPCVASRDWLLFLMHVTKVFSVVVGYSKYVLCTLYTVGKSFVNNRCKVLNKSDL